MSKLYPELTSTYRYFLLVLLILMTVSVSAQPVITSFSPSSGPKGTTVTINGSQFNSSKDSNVVYFGGVKAQVLTASSTTLTVLAPGAATFDPLSVLNTSTWQIGYSYKSFLLTFNGGATLRTTINTTQNAPVSFATATYPYQTVAADLDGDGRPDLLVNNGLSIQIFRNTTTPGTFNSTSFAKPQAYAADGYSLNFVLRDLNGDGKLDLLCSASDNNFKVHIYMNTSTPGNIAFAAGQTFPFGGGVIDAADIDGDGKLDMLTAFGGGVAVWLNTTAPGAALSFANPVAFGLAAANISAMAVSDIDGDGKPDIVTANGTGNTLTILRNTARPGVINDSSLAPYVLIPMQRPASYIAINDLDGDKKPDIVVTTDSGVAVLKNLAAPGTITTASFGSEIDIATGTLISGVVLGDLDGDGKPDIVTADFVGYGNGFTSILKNISSPGSLTAASFAPKNNCYVNGWSNGTAIADLDGDGKPELLISGGPANQGGSVSILQPVINTLPPAISSISPDSSGVGGTITIRGRYFSGASAITLGGVPVTTFTVHSDTLITAGTGNGASGSVSVTTPLGSGTLAGFTYVGHPRITGFTPTSAGRGDTMVISGSGFTDADTLSFGGIAPVWFSVVSDNTIKAVLGGTGASGSITVKTPFGVDTTTGFTYLRYPLLTSFSPAGGKTGDTISIHGIYLTSATGVTFGGSAATALTVVSDTVVTAIVGAGGSGKIGVTTPTGTSTIDGFTYIYPAPTITGYSPASGPVGSSVTITGSGFDPVPGNNIVYFGAVRGYVTQGNSTSLTVTVPSGATYQPLTVTTHRKTAWSKPFDLTFTGGGSLSSTSFAAPVTVGQGYVTTLADVDGDGKLDIATFFNNNLAFYHNTGGNGQLAFGAAIPTPSPTGIGPQAISFFDADGDGRLDPLIGYSDGRPIMVYPNNSGKGNISVGSGQSWVGSALDQCFVAPGDFNGDGQPDVATTSNYARLMTVMTNTSLNSSLGFTGSSWAGPYLPNETVVSDLDGDGKPDVIIDGSAGNEIVIYRNTTTTATAAFSAAQYTSVPAGLSYLLTADIDGDGKPDLVVSTSSSAVYVYRNTSTPGTISFAAPVSIPLGGNPGYLAIGDLDGDGQPDIAAVQSKINTLTLLHNGSTPGTFSFADTANITIGASTGMVAIGDINGDGRPDIVLNTGYNQAVYLSQINVANLPVINTVTPDTAGGNATVTISGKNFTGATAVSFGGAPAASYTVVSDAVITATLGQGGSGSVLVTTPAGTAAKDSFVYVYPAPIVTGFTPATAATGTTVTITGSHFTGVTSVTFGGAPATSFSVINDGTITAIVGSDTSGSVAVTDISGKDSLGGFSFIPPPPTVTAFNPTTAAPGTTVIITGTGFTHATAVTFNGTPATSFTVVSSTTITAIVGNGSSGSVTVSNAEGTGSLGGFTYNKPTPTITSFSPTKAPPGSVLTLVGTNLGTTTAVTIGGIPVASFIASADTIQAVLAAGDSGYIYVTTPYGTVPASGSFTLITPIATLTSFSPATATTGTTVTITGTHLTNATGVSFGGTAAASFYIYSDNEIIATVGSGASGNLIVSTPNGPDTLTGFVYNAPPPTIVNFNLKSGKQGDQIYISGTNLTGTKSVTFGGVAASSFSVINQFAVVATVGNGASGNVVVTTATGSDSMSGFVFIPPTPVLTSFSPTTGAGGSLITLHGKYLTGTSWVQIGQWYAQDIHVLSDTVVTAVINNNGSSGTVIVTTPGGSASLGGFTWLTPGTPSITGISPSTGGSGTLVTIIGTNLFNVTSATFGGIAATSITVVSPDTVTAVVGQGATGTVAVSAPGYGSASFNGFTYTGSSTDTTPTTPPVNPKPPVLYSFSPSHAKQGQTVTLYGANLDSTIFITFGGVSAQSFRILNDSVIAAIVGTGASGQIIVRSTLAADSLSNFVFDTTAITPPPSDSVGTTPPPVDSVGTTPPPSDSVGTTPPDSTSTPPPAYQLTQFSGTAVANQSVLQWKALNEKKIAIYLVEQSTDTTHFLPIAAIASRQQDSASYVFTDTASRTGVNFYRLAIINTSFDTTLSSIVTVQLAGVPATISVYPNPSVGGYFYVNTPSIASPSRFEVVDMSGNTIQLIPVTAGTAQVRITITSEMKGVYKIVWTNGSQSSYQTILIMR